MGTTRVRELWPRGGARAPRMVIDEGGGEVGVLVDFGQYLVLLQVIASELDGKALPHYWRKAIDECLAVSP